MSERELPRELELLADEALQGLCPNEWAELDRLLPPSAEREAELCALEALAAEVALGEVVVEGLPAHLAARLVAASELGVARAARLPIERGSASAKPGRVVSLAPRRSVASFGGWLVAAAVTLGFVLAWPKNEAGPESGRLAATPRAAAPGAESPSTSVGGPRPAAPAIPHHSLAEARQALLATSAARRAAWVATQDPAGLAASGDVVWNAHEQKGFMRFHGLAPNDPRSIQYQLWIFDAERDEKHPVDGGVFDVGADGEIIVAIDARVPVHRATLFAITIEPPGGVVVSKRERIVVTAALPPT